MKGPLVTLCVVMSFVSLQLFWQDERLVLIALIVVAIIMLAVNWSLEHLIVYLAMLAIGFVTEILSIQKGIWSYPTYHSFGFPLWVPFMWANGALFIVEMKEWVDEKLAKFRS